MKSLVHGQYLAHKELYTAMWVAFDSSSPQYLKFDDRNNLVLNTEAEFLKRNFTQIGYVQFHSISFAEYIAFNKK